MLAIGSQECSAEQMSAHRAPLLQENYADPDAEQERHQLSPWELFPPGTTREQAAAELPVLAEEVQSAAVLALHQAAQDPSAELLLETPAADASFPLASGGVCTAYARQKSEAGAAPSAACTLVALQNPAKSLRLPVTAACRQL